MTILLTRRQQQVLDFISRSIDRRGYPPTLREIGNHFGIKSTNGVNDHLKALEKKGALSRRFMKSRALSLLGQAGNVAEIPLLGRVAAGQPVLALEEAMETVRIDRFFIGSSREVFALRVTGESMIEAGIHDGDYIFVQKAIAPKTGDIVVALIEDEATVKRFFPEGERVRLQPENPKMAPIYVSASDFRSLHLLGVVVGVYRKLT